MVPTTSTNMDVLLSYESVVLEILNNIGNLSLGEKLTGFNDLIKAGRFHALKYNPHRVF